MADKNHKQHMFNEVVKRIVGMVSPDLAGVDMKLTLDEAKTLLVNKEEFIRVLQESVGMAQTLGFNGNTSIKLGKFKGISKNSTTRGGLNPLTPIPSSVEPVEEFDQKAAFAGAPTQKLAFKNILRIGRPFSSGELAERMGLEGDNTCKVLDGLRKKGIVRRRKARKDDEVSANTRFVYEVAV
jgi:hypothetical protein